MRLGKDAVLAVLELVPPGFRWVGVVGVELLLPLLKVAFESGGLVAFLSGNSCTSSSCSSEKSSWEWAIIASANNKASARELFTYLILMVDNTIETS